MSQRQLASTLSEGLRPLGQPELRSYELITDVLAEALSPAHAALFAEPVRSPYGDRTDWYTGLGGTATPLTELDPERAAIARAELTRLGDDIRAHADALAASGDANDARLAEALQNALQVPRDTSVLVVDAPDSDAGLQPVLIDWASLLDTQTTAPNILRGMAPARAQAAPPPPPPVIGPDPTPAEPPRRGIARWLWPLLLLLCALLMALILYLLFVSCGLRHVPFLNFCPVAEDIDDPARDTAILQNRIALLQRELAAAERSCQPVATEPQILLTWDGPADLDLSLFCPDGSRVWFRDKHQAVCGARLDFDENAASTGAGPSTRERITLEDPPEGDYRIRVELFENWTEPGDQPFVLDVNFGTRQETFRGTVSPERRIWEQEYGFRR
ncbi:MAG: hypothetical protein OIF47_05045 [Marinibacterium sp.]|nr:hypothetical protein [Marinibacterium sp.]